MTELKTNEAGEGRSGQRAGQLGLRQQTRKQVNVVRMRVQFLHSKSKEF